MRCDKIRVGDVLFLKQDQRVPVDCLLLHTSDNQGTVFVRTDQLDGETDWKLRESIRHTHALVGAGLGQSADTPGLLLSSSWNVVVEAPRDQIYEFNGNFFDQTDRYEPLRIENTLWQNMKIAAGDVFALAIYVGSETRVSLNSQKAVDKFGKTDDEINWLFKLVFVILVCASLGFFLLSGGLWTGGWLVEVVRVFAILSTLLPFMLKLNVDFAKLFYSHEIGSDKAVEGAVVRNRQIPEELGRVEYLLSDKTGTLTRNEMVFKLLKTKSGSFGADSFADLRNRVLASYKTQDRESGVREAALALLLCNNVSPTIVGGQRVLQASSPDEVALSTFAESLGLQLVERRSTSVVIRNPLGENESFEVLENFPFSSERKRMGVLLREKGTGLLLFLLKGADSALQMRVNEEDRIFLEEECDGLSREGLRTLVLAQRRLSEQEYKAWKEKMKRASSNLRKRAEEERKVIEELERGLSLVGVTGVEDLLQEDVKSAISTLRSAGIKVWMLTGDKLETAKCVAISTGFKSVGQRFFEVTGNNEAELAERLDRFDPEFSVLLIPGDALAVILSTNRLKDTFVAKALKAKSVVLCRCAPKQKAEIANLLKKECGRTVCGVGDGGNDVGMIQAASVGIGIEGKEGLQASLASDFSVKTFKHLVPLFLWHGRLSYVRTATLANLVVHRGFVVTTVQFLFMTAFHFVTINIFNGYLNMFYGTLFTNLLVFSVVLDIDVPRHQLLNYPQLYRLVQEGQELSAKRFCLWVFKAIFQGSAIILIALAAFTAPFLTLATIAFTSLILTEYLTILLVVRTWHRLIVAALLLSLAAYLACLLLLPDLFLLSPLTLQDHAKIVLLVLASWLPFALAYKLKRSCCPDTVDKIVMEAKTIEKRKRGDAKRTSGIRPPKMWL